MSKYRQLRGLALWARQIRRCPPEKIYGHRGLVPIGGIRGASSERGKCCWCGLECEKTRQWHTECVAAHAAAKGAVRKMCGTPVISGRKARCDECGVGDDLEIDHRLALSIGYELGLERWIRAHQLSNLRWLCHACHVVKTRDDRAALKWLRRLRAGEPVWQPQRVKPAAPVSAELFSAPV